MELSTGLTDSLIGFIISFISCVTGTDGQYKRDNVVNAKELTYNIDCDDVLIGSIAQPYIFGKYLIIVDYKSMNKLIHVFDKDNFKWLYSFGDIGQGPNDISSIGTIACNNDTHEISLWTMPRESCSATMLTVCL